MYMLTVCNKYKTDSMKAEDVIVVMTPMHLCFEASQLASWPSCFFYFEEKNILGSLFGFNIETTLLVLMSLLIQFTLITFLTDSLSIFYVKIGV